MSIAVGGSSASSSLPPRGSLWVDVRNYGAKADNGVTDNSVPIQAAIDALAAQLGANGNGPKGIVYIPCRPSALYCEQNTLGGFPQHRDSR